MLANRVLFSRTCINVRPSIMNCKLSTTTKGTGTSEDEISHFRNLAPSWWDTNGSQRILHKMNLSRVDFIRRNLGRQMKIQDQEKSDVFIPGYDYKQFFPQDVSKAIDDDLHAEVEHLLDEKQYSVLDVGCGGGILSESLGRLPFIGTVLGIDLTPECISVAKEHARQDPMLDNKVKYETISLEEIKSQYDIVTCFEMLEHVDRPDEILRHAWKRVKLNGFLFLSTINRDCIAWFTTIMMAEYIINLVPKGTHDVSKFIKSSEIVEWFEKRQPRTFKIRDLKGTMYIPTQGWVEHNCASIGNFFMAIQKIK